jgi:hypothetical protein
MTVSMEKVVTQIQSKKQSRKLGRYEVDMVYRIQPSARQCANAQAVVVSKGRVGKVGVGSVGAVGKGAKGKGAEKAAASAARQLRGVAIPMFSAQVCITIIGVFSVYVQCNCVYYCDTCYMRRGDSHVLRAGRCHVIELHKIRLFIYMPRTKSGLLSARIP